MMPRRTIDLLPYLDAIRVKVADRQTYADIAAWLGQHHDVHITASWLQQKCRNLGIQSNNVSRTTDEQVHTIIEQRFFHTFDSDEMISAFLRNADVEVSVPRVKFIRLQHGWLRKARSDADTEGEQLRVNASIEQAYEEGVVRQYGYRLMHTALRNRGIHARRYASS